MARKAMIENEDGSIDIIVSIKPDSGLNAECSECHMQKVCHSKPFKKVHCLISELFGINCVDKHIEITM